MKAISIRNPWAYDIFCGVKPYEFRTWNTTFRGDLLICSSANPKIKGTFCGCALVVCTLSDVTQVNKNNYKNFDIDKPNSDQKLYAWHLTNFRIIKPFKVKGKLGFYEVSDKLIEFIDFNSFNEDECDQFYLKYFVPFLC